MTKSYNYQQILHGGTKGARMTEVENVELLKEGDKSGKSKS